MVTPFDELVDASRTRREDAATSAERAWAILDAAPDGMLLTDGDGTIQAVNQQVERMFGYQRSALIGREIEVLLAERLRERHLAHRAGYHAAPAVRVMGERLQLRARRRDGSEFPVEVSLSPLDDVEGPAVVVSVRDVTERHRINAHTRRIQAAIDAVHDGVFMFENDSLRFVYANEGASVQTEYSNSELLDMTPLDITPGYSRAQFEELIAPLLAGDVPHLLFRATHRSKSGRDLPVDIVLEHRAGGSHPLFGAVRFDSEPDSLLVAIARDVTEQVAVQRRLELSEGTFRASFDNAPVAMTVARLDEDGRSVLERVNRAFAEMLGRPMSSLIGVDATELEHPGDRQSSRETAVAMGTGTRDSFIGEARYLRADGTAVWVLVHSCVIDRLDGVLTLTHVVDLTDRRARQVEHEQLAMIEDRERIARDLHDLVIQRLFGAGMKLNSAVASLGPAAAQAHEVIDELDETIRELRSAIFSLHNRDVTVTVSDEVALAIDQSVDRLGFRPSLAIEGPFDAIGTLPATELTALIREALANVARHAGASHAKVRIIVTPSAVVLTVSDDGCGIDTSRPRGHGLENMERRATGLGGTFDIRAPAFGGTELVCTIPR